MCELLGGWQERLACPIKCCVMGRKKREDTLVSLGEDVRTLSYVTATGRLLVMTSSLAKSDQTSRRLLFFYIYIYIYFILKATNHHYRQVRGSFGTRSGKGYRLMKDTAGNWKCVFCVTFCM